MVAGCHVQACPRRATCRPPVPMAPLAETVNRLELGAMVFMRHQKSTRISEFLFFPYTTSLRFRVRVTLLLMAAITGGLGIVLREDAFYVLGAFSLLCDVPIEAVFFTVRKRRTAAYCNGEDRVGTVVRKRAFCIGPQFAVGLRYSMGSTIVESSRQIPFEAWLPLHVGDTLQIRVERDRPRNWAFCWTEMDLGVGIVPLSGNASGSGRTQSQ